MKLDKQSRTVLKSCIDNIHGPDNQVYLYNVIKSINDKYSTEDIISSLYYLKKQKLLVLFDDRNTGIEQLVLTYEGLHYHDFKKEAFKSYIADKWISILALFISFIALFVSFNR